MKYLLALALLVLASPVFSADDPGARYVDAFLLIQEGDAAKGKSDWKAAYTKFSAAQNILFDLKTNSATWNPHLVQFRLDYCTEQLDAIKPNLSPTAPGLSATFVAPKRGTPADAVETQQLRADLADALKQIETLKKELEDSKKAAPPNAAELDKLRTQLADARTEIERAKAAQLTAQASLNKKDADEAARMAEVNQKIADLQKQISDRNRKLEEMDKLRANLAAVNTRADALAKQNDQLTAQLAAAKTTATQLDEARKANTDLQTQLAEAKRLAATGAGDLQKLRAELLDMRAAADRASQQNATQLAQLQKENQTLAVQLADSKRSLTTIAAGSSAELQTLRAELTAARADAQNARTGNATQLDALRRERDQLASRLAAAESRPSLSESPKKGMFFTKPVAVPAVDEELRRQNRDLTGQLSTATRQLEKLRNQATTDARANAARGRKLADELDTLKDQNRELAQQLASAKRSDGNRGVLYRSTSAAPRTESTTRLENENGRLAAQLADARRQVTSLRQQLTAATAPAPAVASVENVKADLEYQMRRLREENTLLRQLLNRYASHKPELKREAEGHAINLSPRK